MNGPKLYDSLALLLSDATLPQDLLAEPAEWLTGEDGVAHVGDHPGSPTLTRTVGTVGEFLRLRRCRRKPCTPLLNGLGTRAAEAGHVAQAFAESWDELGRSSVIPSLVSFASLTKVHKPFERLSGGTFDGTTIPGLNPLAAHYYEFLSAEHARRSETYRRQARTEVFRDRLLHQAATELTVLRDNIFGPVNQLIDGHLMTSSTQSYSWPSHSGSNLQSARPVTSLAGLIQLRGEVPNLRPITLLQLSGISTDLLFAFAEPAVSDQPASDIVAAAWRAHLLVEIDRTEAVTYERIERYRTDQRRYLVFCPAGTGHTYSTDALAAYGYDEVSQLAVLPHAVAHFIAYRSGQANHLVELVDSTHGEDHALLHTVHTLWSPNGNGAYTALTDAYQAACRL